MGNEIRSIELDKLLAHPGNPNRMSREKFGKLVANIRATGFYEPIVVRRHPEREGFFQIINGHHRCKALGKLGYERADCVVWEVGDRQTDILLATLNRLGGSDEVDKKIELLRRLRETAGAAELGKLLPQTRAQIERLMDLQMPRPAEIRSEVFARAMVFFVGAGQEKVIEEAIILAEGRGDLESFDGLTALTTGFVQDGLSISDCRFKKTKAQRRAEAIVEIARQYVQARK